ncbi:hypothetical protein KPH14_006841 [Odynerus spinipes]|uniref:Uncharacterized protein n=1 Tax=Odynerus spinipes TaxID=1348599 RepID=A0AAD9RSI8_9HYME|nr:hypothetical protein KPH14_006841 [Odynerus spinipes]
MSTRDSRYFQTLEFIFYISKGFSQWRRILAFALLLGLVGFFAINYHYESKASIETSVSKEKTNIFLIETHRTLVEGQRDHPKCSLNGREITTSGNYCEISQCKAITCTSIPVAYDPGNLTSHFIESVFKVRCPTTDTINLIYENCRFLSNTLSKDWLKINISIEQLTFAGCSLNRIHDEAFYDKIFAEVETLSLLDNKISSLSRNVFGKFFKLKQLLVQNNIVDYAESDLLADVANSLEVLQLDAVIKDREVLRNITGKKILSNLKSLMIRENYIPVLSPELFTGVPKIRSLFVDGSGLTEIGLNSFGSMAGSLELLILKHNQLSTLPNGIFNFVLPSKRQFRVYLTENIWNCDCELKWIQEFIQRYPFAIIEVPLCTTPEANAQLSFVEARFCNENNTDTSTTTQKIEITSEDQNDSSIDRNTIGVVCSKIVSNNFLSSKIIDKTLPPVDYEFQRRFQDFVLTELNDGTILVDLPDLEGEAVLLWFENQFQKDIQGSIHCTKNVKGSYVLKDTSPSTTYTVCLSDNQQDGFSPLNCLGITTQPGLEDRPWLTNGHKTVVCLILITLVLFFCAISSFCMFIVIRRHPSLLKGSKRVMLIKHRKLRAMVLPRDVEIDENGKINETDLELQSVKKKPADRKFYTEDGYMTPLPPNKLPFRKDSRTSRISFHSYATGYVSGIEPASWRLYRSKSEIAANDIGPPPLPPHPQRVIPSVSMVIDSTNVEDDRDDLNEIM